MRANQIRKPEGLENLKELIELNLSDNQISSLKGIELIYSLKKLILNGNIIKSTVPLENLKNLITINLQCNKLHDISGITLLKDLSEINIAQNPILEKIKRIYPKISEKTEEFIDINDFLQNLPIIQKRLTGFNS